jgi:hypothetical protein
MSICAILYARDYAGLVGLTPEKFLNRFLEDFLTDPWDDRNDNGNAEYYLGSFALKDLATAERLADWMQYRFEKLGYGPEVKFEVEVIESPSGKFRVVAASFSRGQMCRIPARLKRLQKRRDLPVCFWGTEVRRSLPAPQSLSLLQAE